MKKLFSAIAALGLIAMAAATVTPAQATSTQSPDPEVSINKSIDCGTGERTFSGTADYHGDTSTRLRVVFNPEGNGNLETPINDTNELTNWSFVRSVTVGTEYEIEAKVWDNTSGEGSSEDSDSWTFTQQACEVEKTPVCADDSYDNYGGEDGKFDQETEEADNELCSNDPTGTPTPTPEPTQPPQNPGGPGDGKSDGRSDGRSSCPECTAPPSGQVLGATTDFAGTGTAVDMLVNAIGAMGGISTAAGFAMIAKKKKI